MRKQSQERRVWVLIAAIAIGITVLSLGDLRAASHRDASSAYEIRSQVASWLLPQDAISQVRQAIRSTTPATSSGWLAILPILFVGMISPLSLLPRLGFLYASRVPDAPALPSRFQRPPPIRRG